MVKLNSLKKIVADKQKKNLDKVNSCRERFEKIKKCKIADLKEAQEIVDKLNDIQKWRQSIP